MNLILHNFFSFKAEDVGNFQRQADISFKNVSKESLAKLFIENKMSLEFSESKISGFNLRTSALGNTMFFKEEEKCASLVSMCTYYKLIMLIIKKLSEIMEDVTLDKLEMFTKFSFDSAAFLAEKQQDVDQRHALVRKWKSNLRSLEAIQNRITNELSKQKVVSAETHNSLLKITQFLILFCSSLLQALSKLKELWTDQNNYFCYLSNLSTFEKGKKFFTSKNKNLNVIEAVLSKDSKMDEFNYLIRE